MAASEKSSLPKCIGPGCERDALPDSVYCGNDCILKHAAAAMKTITTDCKETKPKEKPKPKVLKKPAVVTTVKVLFEDRHVREASKACTVYIFNGQLIYLNADYEYKLMLW